MDRREGLCATFVMMRLWGTTKPALACQCFEVEYGCIAEPSAGPNDEERGRILIPTHIFLARSSSSVSLALGRRPLCICETLSLFTNYV